MAYVGAMTSRLISALAVLLLLTSALSTSVWAATAIRERGVC